MGKNFVKYWIDDKIPDEYYWQCIHYFIVMKDLETLDFIIHNPEPYDSTVRTKIIKITRDMIQEDIMRGEMAICNFQAEYATMLRLFVSNAVAYTKK